MFTGVHMLHSATHVSCVFICVPWSHSQQSRPRQDMPALVNRHSLVSYSPVDKYAWLPFHANAPRHACARELVRMFTLCICLCSNTPSIICTGSHPLHPLTNNKTKRERGVGTGDSQYPLTLYPSLHARSRSPRSPATSGRPQHHLTVCVQGPLNPTTPRCC